MSDRLPDPPRPFDRAQLERLAADPTLAPRPAGDVVARLVATARAAYEAADRSASRCQSLQEGNRELLRQLADSAFDGAAEVLAAEVLMQIGLWDATGIEVHPGSTSTERLRDTPPWAPAWVAVLPDDHLVGVTVDNHLALIGPPRERFAELARHDGSGPDEGIGL